MQIGTILGYNGFMVIVKDKQSIKNILILYPSHNIIDSNLLTVINCRFFKTFIEKYSIQISVVNLK